MKITEIHVTRICLHIKRFISVSIVDFLDIELPVRVNVECCDSHKNSEFYLSSS